MYEIIEIGSWTIKAGQTKTGEYVSSLIGERTFKRFSADSRDAVVKMAMAALPTTDGYRDATGIVTLDFNTECAELFDGWHGIDVVDGCIVPGRQVLFPKTDRCYVVRMKAVDGMKHARYALIPEGNGYRMVLDSPVVGKRRISQPIVTVSCAN